MSNISKRIAELSPERRELLARLLKRERLDVSSAVIMPRSREHACFPLSYAQQRLWFLHQLEPDTPVYNLPDSHYFKGSLDISALERSLTEIIRRHESLRTTFRTVDAEPRQFISPPFPIRLSLTDLSSLTDSERAAAAQRELNEEAQRVFDLSQCPLFRARLLRLREDEHLLMLTMHHIISDGWSIGVLVKELTTLYEAYREGRESPLEELGIQYVDYAEWQRAWLRGEVLEEQLRYWREQLSGELPVLELPTDRPHPPVQTYRGASEFWEIDARLTRRLKEISRQEGATLYMTLMAAFNVLLARYSNQTDILVGTPIANRNRAETEALIGFFVNTLVIRCDLSGNPTFRELLAQVREATLGAYAHQDVPFEKLVEELQPERGLGRVPLFRVVFAMQNAPAEHLNLAGMSTDIMQADTETSKFDLRLAATEAGDTLHLSLRYSTDLFDASRMQRMLEHFEHLLSEIAADPSRKIASLPILPDRERGKILTQWNESRASFPSTRCLHELFAAQVERTPQAIAVASENERLTYAELERRANRLANHLRSLGVGPEVLVGICLERSPNMIVALLGVLKAGGAYLPLEPEQPPERLAFMIEDARPHLLLTERGHLVKFAERGVEVVLMDGERESAIARESEEAPAFGATLDSLAYIIYTSGSTGKPKGVAVTHANVARLFAATRDWFHFDERDVWTLFHSYAFDFSVWEMWGALLYGGRLVVVPYLVSRSPEDFFELLLRERVTVLNQTPSAFRQLMRADEKRPEAQDALCLRLVIFGGEALELHSLKPWFERHGDARPRLVNMYGITETTVHVTYRPLSRLDAGQAAAATGSPIGMPIPDLQIYVLDGEMNLVPYGIAGEMYVGGAGLARNYLNRAALTAERFTPDPFSARRGARLYKTGDLVRLSADGELEYLGRCDHQVKLRGFRIELGEIEAALSEHPSIGAAVVIIREDRAGDKRLVAYLLHATTATEPSVDELRAFLSRKLPDHMIPSAFVALEAFPLTVNGKIDRRRLPAPAQSRPSLRRGYVAPRDALEMLVATMWRELLGIEQVGIEDDFFGLGGDSIKGAIFINRLQERLGEIVHVINIFQFPTVGQLSAYLREQYREAVRRVCGAGVLTQTGSADSARDDSTTSRSIETDSTKAVAPAVSAAKLAQVRQLIKPLPPRVTESGRISVEKNPPAIFVLSPPRSGSTLFRVMLAGHPTLFAPPELELLSFNTLAERRAAFDAGQSFWLEGTIRAVMEIKNCSAAEAKAFMEELEARALTTKECYRQLQQLIGGKRLVDKTPSYALHRSILERAETDFENPLYIHLLRHPYGMIRSFEEARLEQIFFRYEHGFSRRELAELIWTVSNENISEFLRGVPPERQHRVRFEDLLEQPETALRRVCDFLRLEFSADMLQPYRNKERRMTDGIHAESRMLGDVKFHNYTGIDARTAGRWREQPRADSLAAETWALAEQLGYERETEAEQPGTSERAQLKPIPHLSQQEGAPPPLSFAQQRLWFIHQLMPESAVYNIPLTLQLSGALNLRALEQSLGEIVKRHASLRTIFPASDGEPFQFILPAHPLSLAVLDLMDLPDDVRDERALQLADEEAQQPFNLSVGPLLRIRLLRLREDEHVLMLTMHHIISDGWSIGVLVKELTTLYEAYREGRESPLEELAIQYVDYAIWQRAWLRGEVLEKQLRYWREQLSGELPVLELPTDRPRPAMQSYRGAVEDFELSEDVSRRLKEIGREAGATLFTTLLAAFNALLYRYTRQTDICAGTPTAGRNRVELEKLVGLFVNTLVLRTRIDPNSDFLELLRQVKDVTRGAYRHQDVPFEKLVDELQPPRDPSHTPLFQVMFTLQDASQETLKLGELEMNWIETDAGFAKFDLSLAMTERDGHLSGLLIYNTDLFDAATVERMARHFEVLLAGIAANPQQRISALPLLTCRERQQILCEWNETRSERPPDFCIHELFEQQSARTPSAVAAVFQNESLTYAELNRRANQLARHLISQGIGAESLVAVLLPRSLQMLVALVGILKAGAAYVALDAAYPPERIAFMLEDANVSALLTQQSLAGQLPAHAARLVVLDADHQLIARQSVENPSAAVTSQNPAYVIYTSGSTGKPKGVAITHGSAAAFLSWAIETFQKDVLSGVLASTSICFDLSVFELFAPLACGGSVILAANALELADLPARQQVTLVNTVPSAMAELVRMQAIPESVRVVNLAGEVLKNQLAQSIYEVEGVEQVWNLYGPTEDTTYTTCALVEKRANREPSIGRAVKGTQVYVLDEELEPVPVGVAGEIYVAGAGLARGYLNRAAMTAEKFLPNPHSAEPGARMYRTGDLARYRPDGEIEFLGRADHQVKVRGYRIEPGEIEARLSQHEGVREAVVMAQADGAGDKRLTAYVVVERRAALSAEELRRYLRERLPEYMTPSSFVLLEEMPRTPNGKIDRKALPSLDAKTGGREQAFVPPRDALERKLARLWEDILNVRPIGIKENFFDLGGHSLLAVRMMAQLRKQIGRDLPLASILHAQTIEELASLLRGEGCAAPASASPLVVMQPQGTKPPFFCVHPAGGSIVCYAELSRHLGLEQPFYGVRASLLDGGEAPLARIEEMAARYVEALRGVQPAGPYMLGGWSMGGVVAFEMAQQLHRRSERVSILALIDSRAPNAADAVSIGDEELLLQFIWYIGRLFGMEEWLMRESEAEARGVEQQLRSLLEEAGRVGAVPPDLGLEQIRQLFQVYRLNVRAMLGYQPQRYPGRITLFRASEHLADSSRDPLNGWGSLAAEGVEFRVVPGDHYTIMKEPHVQVMAEWLKACIEQALIIG